MPSHSTSRADDAPAVPRWPPGGATDILRDVASSRPLISTRGPTGVPQEKAYGDHDCRRGKKCSTDHHCHLTDDVEELQKIFHTLHSTENSGWINRPLG